MPNGAEFAMLYTVAMESVLTVNAINIFHHIASPVESRCQMVPLTIAK